MILLRLNQFKNNKMNKRPFEIVLKELVSVNPEDIVSQLFALHTAIQNADEQEILAIYHTLKTYETKIGGTQDLDSFQAIKQMLEGVKSRMCAIILKKGKIYGEDAKRLFKSTTTFSFSHL